LWLVSGGAVALLVMMVGFFFGARTETLRAAQQTHSFTLAAPVDASWTVDGAAIDAMASPEGLSSVTLSVSEQVVVAETPDGARLRVQVGPSGIQTISLESTETEKNP
jgi:hypothetical protein